MDPRVNVIEDRLKDVSNIIAVAGGKGGIGKSTVASMLALILAQADHRVGLLDLDFTGSSTHTILGFKDFSFPDEDRGIIPPKYHNISYITMENFAESHAAPFRGKDITNAILELLAITRWDDLDFLIIDMPPGINDTTLDILRFIKRIQFCIITTPSKVTLEVVKRSLQLLKELDTPLFGIFENATYPTEPIAEKLFPEHFLGSIPYDPTYESAIGDPDKLLETTVAKTLKNFTRFCEKMC